MTPLKPHKETQAHLKTSLNSHPHSTTPSGLIDGPFEEMVILRSFSSLSADCIEDDLLNAVSI